MMFYKPKGVPGRTRSPIGSSRESGPDGHLRFQDDQAIVSERRASIGPARALTADGRGTTLPGFDLNPVLDSLAERVATKLQERSTMQPPSRLLDVAGAAAYLSRSQEATRRLAREGKVPMVRDGRFILFDRRDLDEWIEKHKAVG